MKPASASPSTVSGGFSTRAGITSVGSARLSYRNVSRLRSPSTARGPRTRGPERPSLRRPPRVTSRLQRGTLARMSEVTRILSAIDHGDPHAAEQLLPLVYDELRRLAAAKMAQEKPGQ